MSREFAAAAMERHKSGLERLKTSRRHFRMRASWTSYYSRALDSGCDETEVATGGEKGELIKLSPNVYRRLIQDQLSQVQQTPPDYQPEAINSDPEAQAQCSLSLGVLDQYKRTKHLEEYRNKTAELALCLSEGFRHVRWDPQAGKEAMPMVDPQGAPVLDQKTGQPRMVFEGDHVISVRTSYEVTYEPNSPDPLRPRWWIVQEPENKFDLMAQFGADSPDIAAAIMGAPKWSSFSKEWNYEQNEDQHDDTIAVYWVYYERCRALPEGRCALIVDDKTVLLDGAMDEDRAGVFRLAVSDVIFRSESHTSNFDGLPLSAAYKSIIGTIATNFDAGGVQRMIAARKSNIDEHALGTSLSIVDYDHTDMTSQVPVPKPEMLDTLFIKPEHFTYEQLLSNLLDKVMGGSPVTRGDPEATKGDSGSKAAMLFAAAQSVSSGFVRAVLRSDEEVATHIISSLRRHATVPRLTSILGDDSEYTSKRFVGEDLSKLSRINVRQANPARDTFQGRMAIAELLADKTPEQQQQTMSIINTGRIEPATKDIETSRLLIDRENEALRTLTAPPPVAIDTDQHAEHFLKHAACKNDPAIRGNPELLKRYDQHCAEHIAMLTPDSGNFAGMQVLALTRQTPLPPLAAPAPMLGAGGPQPSQGAPPSNGAPPTATKQPTGEGGARMPSLPRAANTGEQPDLNAPAPSGAVA